MYAHLIISFCLLFYMDGFLKSEVDILKRFSFLISVFYTITMLKNNYILCSCKWNETFWELVGSRDSSRKQSLQKLIFSLFCYLHVRNSANSTVNNILRYICSETKKNLTLTFYFGIYTLLPSLYEDVKDFPLSFQHEDSNCWLFMKILTVVFSAQYHKTVKLLL